MPKSICLSLVFLFLFSAKPDCKEHRTGSVIIKDRTIEEDLEVFGNLHFENLTVTGKTKVSGAVDGDQGTFDALDVDGSVDITNTHVQTLNVEGFVKGINITVDGETAIFGFLQARRGKFKDLTITTNKIILINCCTDNILIKSTDKPEDENKTTQTLILQGKCIINGNITFEGENGTIIMGQKAKINGKVIGGKVTLRDKKAKAKGR